jgi:hypothetical protein
MSQRPGSKEYHHAGELVSAFDGRCEAAFKFYERFSAARSKR